MELNADMRRYLNEAINSCLRTVDMYTTQSSMSQVRQVVNAISTDLEYRAKDRHIRINNLVPDDFTMKINKNYLYIVLRNILVNAIKFSPVGGQVRIEVQVQVQVQVQEAEQAAIPGASLALQVLCIEDHGIGMSPSLIHKILTSDKAIEHDDGAGGGPTSGPTGLRTGLILCRQLLELNKFRLDVQSTLGQGTKIMIWHAL
jgi:signal transduction histidine kinase